MSKVSHSVPIFDHRGNARVATSVILVGILAIMCGELLMAFGLPIGQPPRLRPLVGVRDGDSPPVRFVGEKPPAYAACEQQVWPHIESRCLERAEANTATVNSAPTMSPKRGTAPAGTLSPTAARDVAGEGQSTKQQEPIDVTTQNTVPVPTPLPPEASKIATQSEATVGFGGDEGDTFDKQPDASSREPRRPMPHRPSRFHIHLNIRGFHF
jgi:hypothetical protein